METVRSVRIDHVVPANNGMAYSQRTPQVLRQTQSGGENPPPHKQPRTALSPPTQRAQTGVNYAAYNPGVTHASRDQSSLRYLATTTPYPSYPPPRDNVYRPSQSSADYHAPFAGARQSEPMQQQRSAERNSNTNEQIEYISTFANRQAENMQRNAQENARNATINASGNDQIEYIPIYTSTRASDLPRNASIAQENMRNANSTEHRLQESRSNSTAEHLRPNATGSPQHTNIRVSQQEHRAADHIRSAMVDGHHVLLHRSVAPNSTQDHAPYSIATSVDHMHHSQRNAPATPQEVVRIDNIARDQQQQLHLTQNQARPRISLLPTAEYIAAQNMAAAQSARSTRDLYRAASQHHDGTPTNAATSIVPSGAVAAPNFATAPIAYPNNSHVQIELVSPGGTGASGPQPFKKLRLGDQKSEMAPLRVDTRDPPGTYNPQVEAISPTPNDHGQEDLAFRATKDELLQQISRVDREIATVESSILNLKKKQQEIESAASKPANAQEDEEKSQPKHLSCAQRVYSENRKKAHMSHKMLHKLGPPVDFPLYNQPSDNSWYEENQRQYSRFKGHLIAFFKRVQSEKVTRQNRLSTTYSKLMQEWLKKIDKIENSQKRKAKDAKNREFFEKTFPELRKQREDKERFNRVGARIKSEADLEEIMDGLQEQELEEKKMRSYAVVPPIMYDERERKCSYLNNNGRIMDMEAEYKSRQLLNVWTQEEKEIFKEKYLQHPKNFGLIASCLDRKSVQESVQYYYLSKKTENYKQLLRKSRQRTRARNPQKVNNAANNAIVDILSTGVTTRLQREQQQKNGGNNSNTNSSTTTSTTVTTTAATTSSNTNTSATNSVNSTNATSTTTTTTSSNSATTTIGVTITTTTSTSSHVSSTATSDANSSSTSVTNSSSNVNTSTGNPDNKSNAVTSGNSNASSLTSDISSLDKTNMNSSVTTSGAVTSNSSSSSLNSASASALNKVDNSSKISDATAKVTSSASLTPKIIPSSEATTNNPSVNNHYSVVSSMAASTTSNVASSIASSITSSIPGANATVKSTNTTTFNACFNNATKVSLASSNASPIITSSTSTCITSVASSTSVSSTAASNQLNSALKQPALTAGIDKNTISDSYNTTTSGTLLEKKKKERRKDNKDHLTIESSDEELVDNQDKNLNIPHTCVVCKTNLEQYSQSRALPPSQATQYGLRVEQVTPGARVCNTCRCKNVRNRYTYCPLPTCSHHVRGRVKRLRTMPSRWMDLPADIWQTVVQEFQIPADVNKCCSACFNRISRKLSPHLPPSGSILGSPGAAWSDDERNKLRTLLAEHGANWSVISEKLTRPIHQIKTFYLDQRKRLGLDSVVAEYNRTHLGDERRPVLTDEEESGSSTSSCEDLSDINQPRERLSSDTTSANSPSETVSQPLRPTKPDYDSSATETADETNDNEQRGQSGGSYSGQTTITVVNGPALVAPSGPASALQPSSSGATLMNASGAMSGGHSDESLTVKDLMLNVIELQLMKNPKVNQPLSNMTPTISSMLKSDGQDIQFVREYKARTPESSLATLSVVNSHGAHGPPNSSQQTAGGPSAGTVTISSSASQSASLQHRIPPQASQIAATITPVPAPQSQTNQTNVSSELVVLQVRGNEPEPMTLDLSLKRPRDPNPTPTSSMGPIKIQHPIYRGAPQQHPDQYYGGGKSQAVYVSGYMDKQQQHAAVVAQAQQQAMAAAQQQRHQQKQLQQSGQSQKSGMKVGSITLGTPVVNQQSAGMQRYDGILRHQQVTPSPPKMGSITQGTPIHIPGGGSQGNNGPHGSGVMSPQEKRAAYDYYASKQHAQQRQSPTVANYQSRQPTYPMEQQLSSRQIIMNDYITSQQMHGGGSRRGGEKPQQDPQRGNSGSNSGLIVTSSPQIYYEGNQYVARTPPPSHSSSSAQQQAPPQRQGVIQRHRPSPPPVMSGARRPNQPVMQQNYAPLAGHEAFSSLVDVAVRQPQLPVPSSSQPGQNSNSAGGHKDSHHHEGLGKTIADHHSSHRYSQISAIQRQRIEVQNQQQQQQQQQIDRNRLYQHQQQQHEQQIRNHQQLAAAAAAAQQHLQQQHQQQQQQQQQQQHVSSRSAVTEPSTLTAASLIDAIITHTINQTGPDGNPPPRAAEIAVSRAGDRLFQGFHQSQSTQSGDTRESNSNHHYSQAPSDRQSNSMIINVDLDSSNEAQSTGLNQSQQQKLMKEYNDTIAAAAAAARSNEYQQRGAPSGGNYYTHKDERQIIRVAQPPGKQQYHHQSPQRSTPGPQQPQHHLSAFDYVKNRIVEVMRTEDDKRGNVGTSPGASNQFDDRIPTSTPGKSDSPGEMVIDEGRNDVGMNKHRSMDGSAGTPPNFAQQQFSGYAYQSHVKTSEANSAKDNVRANEPKPLMVAKYDPLSDED